MFNGLSATGVFQLTASRRGWRTPLRRLKGIFVHFNSQPHEEADGKSQWILSVSAYFNSQPHEEADQAPIVSLLWPSLFQLTASRRGWHTIQLPCIVSPYFNSQPHEEADTGIAYTMSIQYPISTHSLTKRLTGAIRVQKDDIVFQLTASRRGWRQGKIYSRSDKSISTHSLTKRLTGSVSL